MKVVRAGRPLGTRHWMSSAMQRLQCSRDQRKIIEVSAVGRSVDRSGFSMIELMVVVAVIAVLLAIIIPAVQSSRETARRTECVNNLRQVGVALQNYESLYGHYPAKDHGKNLLGSWIVAILPQLDQRPFYDDVVRAYGGSLVYTPAFSFSPAWEKLRWMTPPGFQCPSDPAPKRWMASYAGNSGTWGNNYYDDGIFRYVTNKRGAYPLGHVSSRDITDGLSNTVAVSEWLHVWRDEKDNFTQDTPRRMIWKLPRLFGQGADVETVVEACRQVPPVSPEQFGWQHNGGIGWEWFGDGNSVSTYVHAMPPNGPSCKPTTMSFEGIVATTGSFHRSGVNAVFADGHVQFVSDSVDLSIWRAMGTRAGEDVVTF